MGLLDALSGRIWHWNKTKDRAARFLCSRLHGSEFNGQKPRLIRNYVYAGWFASFKLLDKFLFDDTYQPSGSVYRSRIASIDAQALLKTTYSLTCASIVRTVNEMDLDNEQKADHVSNFLAGTQIAYGNDVRSWMSVYHCQDENSRDAMLLSELCEAWAFSKDPSSQCLVWLSLATGMWKATVHVLGLPEWDSVVDAEIKAGIR